MNNIYNRKEIKKMQQRSFDLAHGRRMAAIHYRKWIYFIMCIEHANHGLLLGVKAQNDYIVKFGRMIRNGY